MRKRGGGRVARSIFTALFLTACVADLEVPGGAQLECTTSADCPAGLICVQAVGGRCLSRDGDTEPPGIINAEVTSRTNAAGTIVASFSLNESAAFEPVVILGTGAQPEFTLASANGLDYRFELAGSLGEEGEWPVLATVVDDVGNAARGVAVGTVVLDFTAPGVLVANGFVNPDATNPLREPTSLGSSAADYTVVFNTDEPLAMSPVVNVQCSEETVPLTRDSMETSTTLFTFTLDPAAVAASDDTCAIVGNLTDEAGNLAENTPIGDLTLRVDRIAPDVSQANVTFLRHLRVPWGNHQTNYERGGFLVSATLSDDQSPLSVPIAQDAFADGNDPVVLVQVRDSAGSLLGLSVPETNGWSPVQLGGTDVATVFVALVDRAGNISTPVRVIAGEFVATLGGKSPGSLLNPLEIRSQSWFSDSLSEPGDALGEADGIAEVTGSGAVSTGAGDWLRVSFDGAPPDLHDGGVAYDAARGESVLFGGIRENLSISRWSETYTFNGAQWRLVSPTDPEADGNPAARSAPAMAYDPVRQEVVLFGGQSRTGADFGDTWIWNGESWRLARSESASGPAPRRWGRMAYDPVSGRILLGGGCQFDIGISSGEDCGEGLTAATNFSCLYEKTWAWDGTGWTEVATTGPFPRTNFGMAADPSEGILVYGGGLNASGSCSINNPRTQPDDAWRWTGTQWQQVATDLAGNDRIDMAYDHASERIVMMPSTASELSVWENDGWVPVRDPSPSYDPPNRSDASLVSAGDQGLLMYGGCDSGSNRCNSGPAPGFGDCYSCGDGWLWREDRWMQVHEADHEAPESRRFAAATHRPAEPSTLMFGGVIDNQPTNETWRFTGAGWVLEFPENTLSGPPLVSEAALAHDWLRGETVMFGGSMTNAALQRCTSENVALYCADTFRNVDDNWTFVSAAGPTARRGSSAFYDPRGEQVILFGGDQRTTGPELATNTTARWTGSFWFGLSPSTLPPARWSGAAVADIHGLEAFLFGGLGNTVCGRNEGLDAAPSSGPCTFGDEYQWNGSDWNGPLDTDAYSAPPPVPARTPVPRSSPGITYDEIRRRVTLFGGAPNDRNDGFCDGLSTACADLWEWSGEQWARVAVTDATGDGQPGARAGHIFVYDSVSNETVMHGGFDTNDSNADGTWLWRSGSQARPGIRLGIPLAAGEITATELQQVDIVYRGGADAQRVEPGARFLINDGEPDREIELTETDPELAGLVGMHGARSFRLRIDENAGGEMDIEAWCIAFNGGRSRCLGSAPTLLANRDAVLLLNVTSPAEPIETVAFTLELNYDGDDARIELIADPVVAGDVSGAAVQVWSAGRWQPLQSSSAGRADLNAAGSGSPYTSSPVNLRASVPGNLELVPVGVENTLWFSFLPNGANGSSRASIEADYIEARIRYDR
ncbi:MAG: hypothetical protein AAF654_05430 [Myxococcota bacterium]